MKRIKLFESFVLENYSRGRSVKFNMPDLFEMPKGLSKNKVYVVKMTYECENLIYALVDYPQLEKIYESLNLNLIAEKIRWYSQKIYHPTVTGDPSYAQSFLYRKSWNIEILAEAERDMFPYYVYISGESDSLSTMKKLGDLSKKCKVCGDDPSVVNLLPGEITCSLGSDNVVFDPGAGMKLSDIIYDDSGTHKSPSDDDDRLYEGKGYYIRFDSLGAFLSIQHPAYTEFNRFKKVGGNFVVDNSKIFEILPYKPDLVFVRNFISKREGFRDFLDDIFGHLIDQYTPQPIIKAISDILNPEDYQTDKLDYRRVECHNYQKRLLSWQTGEHSKYPDFKNARFFIALPSDKSIVDAFLNKIPKDYNEIYDGIDSLDKSVLKKYMDNYPGEHTLDSFIEVLKYNIYLVNNNSITKEQANLYDGKLPSPDVLQEETNCHFSYGIYKKITLSEINKLTPIELYLDVFILGVLS